MELKDVCERAGVRASDIARLVGVTRISVHYWFVGKNSPNKYLAGKVEKITRALQAALDDGELPFKERPANPYERTREIGLTILKYHKKKTS